MNTDNHLSTPSEFIANRLPLSSSTKLASNALPEDLSTIVSEINAIADRDYADPIALLVLLRTLEQLHREIQEGYFQSALPNSRQSLYALLRDIEENGGWPYIQRWKLQALFANFSETEP
jgi:hypothetical protein